MNIYLVYHVFFMVCIIYKLYCEYTKNSKIQFNVMN